MAVWSLDVILVLSAGSPPLRAQDQTPGASYRIDTAGMISTFAGTGQSGGGGPAVQAQLNESRGVAVDSAGNLSIANCRNDRIRKVDATGGVITIAGTGEYGCGGDRGEY